MSSTPEVVQLLIKNGARLVARLADGRTALHLAAARGNVDMVRVILRKSEENEEEEAKKEDSRRKARIAALVTNPRTVGKSQVKAGTESDDSDIEMVDRDDTDVDMKSTTTGSYVKVEADKDKDKDGDIVPEGEDEPDIYEVNVLSWDTQCSPLHYATCPGIRR
jgi:ankyrin repeat protein